MSHVLNRVCVPVVMEVSLTIVNYATGGETVLPSELSLPSAEGVFFTPSTSNSLGSLIFPVLVGGKVVLFRFVGGVPTEVPATNALNCVIHALVIAESLSQILI